MNRPDAPSVHRNREPIRKAMEAVLAEAWGDEPDTWPRKDFLEIASGTGQHAWWFLRKWPRVVWQPSDLPEQLPGINAWRKDSDKERFLQPLLLDVNCPHHWPQRSFDVVFSANSAHIMPVRAVQSMMRGAGRVLVNGGWFFLYGPFRFPNQPLCASNEAFDAWLKEADSARGLRSLDALMDMAKQAHLTFVEAVPLPANNHLLVWRRQP